MNADGNEIESEARRAVVVEILQQVLADPSHADDYFNKWPASVHDTNPELSAAWGALEHFCNDVDIRRKDPEYETVLLRDLSEILTNLQNRSKKV